MDTIALISGGKDSFFSLLHAISNNHRIVALANLHPPTPNTPATTTTIHPTAAAPPTFTAPAAATPDELDSFMYQTVGHALLPFYPHALSLPLYRHPITGRSADQNLAYSLTANDETEDLLPLLRHIMARHPGVKAVCTGAILSTYQRTRIESVCARLGLTSLSYLWQRGQGALLEEMAGVGLEPRIVKVAAVGLDAERWVWRCVVDPAVRMELEGLRRRWGVHVAGEGGEYETIVVDGPGWRGRIEVEEGQREIVEGAGGVGHLKVLGARFVEREGEAVGQEEWVKDLRKPGLWDKVFADILRIIDTGDDITPAESPKSTIPLSGGPSIPTAQTSQSGNLVFITNLSSPSPTSTITEEAQSVMTLLSQNLSTLNTSFSSITSTTLLLRSMSDFAAINSVYSSFFTAPNPPSRVCVSVGSRLPANTNILLSATIDLPAKSPRKGLHVQSRSYWAPANIGPYSQAISVDGWTALAGMVPLVPSSMEVLNPGASRADVSAQAVMALQHMWRVATATEVTVLLGCVAYVVGPVGAAAATAAWKELWRGWKGEAGWKGLFGADEDEEEEDDDEEPAEVETGVRPPLLIVSVEELPRGCAVEWAGVGFDPEWIQRARGEYYTDDDNDDSKASDDWGVKACAETCSSGIVTSSGVYYGGWANGRSICGGGVGILCLPVSSEVDRCTALAQEVAEKVGAEVMGFGAAEARVYIPAVTGTVSEFSAAWGKAMCETKVAVMFVPVEQVWDCDGQLAGLGAVVRRVGRMAA
ncbi:uncharacterized protein H6S33_005155 [Morchella sextelata]|uniref:uncharacterized protein n=1 Tax=Morchella sextelata TaxID=1174677 RepID=UPI001D03CC0E|nr:uncharacterized protein H6S33_005155 [Morchella sextelata]KAH0605173.1 hypothetical protein H6S33_005155 [Morchella sextelata]